MRKGRIDRRSFLAQVVGGTVGGSALLVLGAGVGAGAQTPQEGAHRRMVVDSDPADPAREPPADGLPPPPPPPPPPEPGRVTDSDAGPNADAAGYGRGSPGGLGGIGRPQPSPAPRQSFVICPGNPRCPE